MWRRRRAAVMGAGTIGLLATLALRLRGLDVPVLEGAKQFGPFDLIFEATEYSPVAFDSMQALAKNGVLVLSSVTGGDRRIAVPADKINLDFVLGNRVMVGTVNANRGHWCEKRH